MGFFTPKNDEEDLGDAEHDIELDEEIDEVIDDPDE